MSRLGKWLLAAFFGVGISTPSATASAESPNDILVVANKSVPVASVGLDELRAIFLKKKIIWPGGDKIEPINAVAGTGLRKVFCQAVLGMVHDDELRYWQDQAVKHSITPPREEPTTGHKRLRKVFGTRGAISYVRRKDALKGVVKVLLVIPEVP